MAVNEMQAWVLQSPKNLHLSRVKIPVPNRDEVLIKIDAVCICNGSDPEIYKGHEGYPTPMVFGHEAAGYIIKVGENVTDWHIGERVSWWCTMGAFAEYIAVNPSQVAMFLVPERITVEESPVLELAIAASRALMPVSENCAGKHLGILGLGPSGLVALQYAKALGVKFIWGWDLYAMRRERAFSLGIDAVFDPSDANFLNDISNLPEADIVLDMMGNEKLATSTFDTLIRKTKIGGIVVSYGFADHGRLFTPFIFQSRRLTLISPEQQIPVIREKGRSLMRWIADGTIKMQPLITKALPFGQLKEALLDLIENPGDEIKVVFTLN